MLVWRKGSSEMDFGLCSDFSISFDFELVLGWLCRLI